jgi:DNA invertase Pin-like site-specific DNA recombinase
MTTIHISASLAQHERKVISERAKRALQAAKARSKVLGNPNGARTLQRAGKGNTAAVA